MKIADELREMLRTEYGITSEAELDAALRKTKGLNIGLFVSKTGRRIDEEKDEKGAVERRGDTALDDFGCGDVCPELRPTRA